MTAPEMTERTAVEAATRHRGRCLAEVSTPTMVVLQIILGVAFLAFWQWSSGRLIDEFMVSTPLAVGGRLWGWVENGTIWMNIWATVHATLLGFLIGAVAGVIGGVWLGLSPFLSRLLNPYIWAFNALPKVALAPLFLLWFGLGIESKIALAAVLVVFLVFVNTFSGVREVDPDLTDCLLLMGATKSQILTRVVLPSATSWIFVGLRTAVPYALIGAIIGELIAANRGLGYLVQLAGSEFDTAGVFAALLVIAVLAVAFNEAVNVLQRRLERWKVLSR
ncbi:ABC transporter permease [Rhodoligotrophos defluvii]|uniref:ABC transporter permease n=1 Tax=Rhodoligotrophos defluvii TaxID=2561934 RepID=UPI001EF0FCF4|nr:ABC transporter permease [Rhodoligotrophos defluvii]